MRVEIVKFGASSFLFIEGTLFCLMASKGTMKQATNLEEPIYFVLIGSHIKGSQLKS